MSVTHVLHTVEMGCQMVQLLSAHIVGPTMCVNLTLAISNLKYCLKCGSFGLCTIRCLFRNDNSKFGYFLGKLSAQWSDQQAKHTVFNRILVLKSDKLGILLSW